MHRSSWDDLKYLLAVAESGSVSRAGRHLQVNHATVLRRVSLFEDRMGISVFERTPQGYSLPKENEPLIEAIREVELAVRSVERIIEGGKAPLSGKVRITSTDTLCHLVLPRVITEMRSEARELAIELISTNAHLDMTRLDAEITVRPAAELPDHLIGEKAGAFVFGVYRARQCADAGGETWLGMSGPLSRTAAARWMEANVPDSQISGSADSFLTLREMVASGAGQAFMPRMLAVGDGRLRECAGIAPQFSVPIWVASHVDLQDVPRIADVSRLLVAKLKEQHALLTGGP
ncbi:LysR family transcriptional regulator [Litoreibacter ponti]|uniref:LysR family transcriptional regulator n=1 Tax=Litoreibacter ponti TaxID=1510457 RepID=A0A2T6BIC1_9RHOB|nr:LysR family transcriptional regulator [Litoreibacter ponti]PTX55802.1 LysR family transcriptional regulator [Litoreibacter ponti]